MTSRIQRYFIIILASVITNFAFSQDFGKTDSLQMLLRNSTQYQKDSIYNKIANEYKLHNSYSQAIVHYKLALESSKEINNTERIGANLNSIGLIYMYMEDYENALNFCIQAQNYCDRGTNKKKLAEIISNIGMIYFLLNNYEQAIQHNENALEIFININDTENTNLTYNRLGIMYSDMGNQKKSHYYLKIAYTEVLKTNNNILKNHIINNIGNVFFKQKEYKKALVYFKKALKLKTNSSNKINTGTNFNNLGRTYTALNQYDSSHYYLNKAIVVAKKTKSKHSLADCYSSYIELYAKIEKYKMAYEYQQLLISIKDSIWKLENNNKISELKIIYETEQKEKENEVLKQINRVQKLETKRNVAFRNSLLIVSLLLIIIVLVIYNRYRLKQKLNTLLFEKNKELVSENKTLKFSETTLKELNESKDMFYNELAVKIQNLHTDSSSSNEKLTEKEIDLSKRELEIFKHIANGSSNNKIAELLFISVRTVEKHKSNILQKLELNSVVDLVKFAIKNNLIEN